MLPDGFTTVCGFDKKSSPPRLSNAPELSTCATLFPRNCPFAAVRLQIGKHRRGGDLSSHVGYQPHPETLLYHA
jgi:hypothetical protein